MMLHQPYASVLLLLAGCDVYGPTLLVGADAGVPDVGVPEVCTPCGTACVNLASDTNNCGTCGHSCEVGCSNGYCKPTVLAGNLGAPHGIALAGMSLYVANSGGINIDVMSKVDGSGISSFADASGGVISPDRLATDGMSLYWTDDTNNSAVANGAVYGESFAHVTCNGSNYYCYLVRNLPSPYGVAIQDSTVFFTTLDAANMSGMGCPTGAFASAVLSCPKGGCATTACNTSGGPVVLAGSQTKLASVAVDATNVYWADYGGKTVRFCDQPSCTSGPKTFAANLGGPWDVITDGTTVYFTDRVAGSIYSCPKSGCGSTPKLLASGLNDPLLLAEDGTNLYVTLYQGGQVVACALPSCTGGPTVLASGLQGPYGVTTDNLYVYWSEEGMGGIQSVSGTVSKLRKP